MTTATKTRRKRCSECGELKPADEVLGRQRLCEQCEEGKDYCRVCDCWDDYSWGGGCRHVQWSNERGCTCGSGSDHTEPENHKESFMVLLSKFAEVKTSHLNDDGDHFRVIHEPLLPQLLPLIEQNRFWTQWHGPLIGGPPDLALRYSLPDRDDWCPTLHDISGSVQEDWGEEAIEQMQLGMSWLTSLDEETIEANRVTAGWIREFLAAPA